MRGENRVNRTRGENKVNKFICEWVGPDGQGDCKRPGRWLAVVRFKAGEQPSPSDVDETDEFLCGEHMEEFLPTVLIDEVRSIEVTPLRTRDPRHKPSRRLHG